MQLQQEHQISKLNLLRKCGLLAHTSAAFLKNCCIEKLFGCLRLVIGNAPPRKTSRIQFGKAGVHPQLALEIAIAPETLYSYYNLSIFKAIAILCGSLLDFRFISLYSFICFANVGYSPTPRQHF